MRPAMIFDPDVAVIPARAETTGDVWPGSSVSKDAV